MSAKAMDRLWSDYQEHHRTAGNRTCHMLGIPLIIIGLLGLLAIPIVHIGGRPIEVSFLIVLAVGAIDIWLDAKLGLLMFVAAFVIYLGARMVAWPVLAGLFVLGWAGLSSLSGTAPTRNVRRPSTRIWPTWWSDRSGY